MTGNAKITVNPGACAAGAAFAAFVLYVACLLVIGILPVSTMIVFANSLFHGLDVTSVAAKDMSLPGIVLGAVLWPAVAAFSALMFAVGYNRMNKR